MPNREQVSVVKIPLSVSPKVENILDGQSRICNWTYNHLLEIANQLREKYIETQDPEIAKTLYTERGLRDLLPGIKTEKPFLKVVHSSLLKNAALRLSQAIQTYQKSRKGKRKGDKTGWPRFRSWGRGWFSLLYDEPGKGFHLKERTLTLSLGMGLDRNQRRVEVQLESTHALKGKRVRNLRIVKQLGQFYAVFTVALELSEEKPILKAIALDPNHKNLAYGVDTDQQALELLAPKWIKKLDQGIDELKAKRDRCQRKSRQVVEVFPNGEIKHQYWEPSRRWKKYSHKIDKLRRKRQDQTKTFLYTHAQLLYKSYDLVAIGDYTPDGQGLNTQMRRAMNNQSLIGRLKEVLSWVALKSGKHFIEFDESGTTRTCSHCNHVLLFGLTPEIREWTCPECSHFHIRDENAAKNGLSKVLRDLKLKHLVPGSGLASVTKRWAWCALPSGIHVFPRGQSCDSIAAPRNSNGSVIASDQNCLISFA